MTRRSRSAALAAALLTLAAAVACSSSKPATKRVAGTASASSGDLADVAARSAAWDEDLPDGPLGASILRGRAILLATRDSLPANVGNQLRCVSCHLDEGRRAAAIPWTGVYARFPQYRSRTGTVIRLEDRVNDCLQRSLNGRPLAFDNPAMRDIVVYLAFISRDTPVGAVGGGLARLDPLPTDTARGRGVFAQQCVRCHGESGQGTPVAPPVWGAGSYNIGAGMARLRTAAAFVKASMPYDSPTLTAQQAYDVAAYIDAQTRPDFPGKELDWPNGDPPPDAAYPTRGRRR